MASDRINQNTGTSSIRPGLGFDPAPLEAWLREHIEGYEGPLRIEQFKGGQSNPTYKLITPGRA